MIKKQIETAVAKALTELGAGEVAFAIERPTEMKHGDYATNAALAAAKVLKKNPHEVAKELANELEGKIAGVKKIEIAGAGFINFTISGLAIKDIVHEAHGEQWGSNDIYKGKQLLVEYTSPNLFKPLHIGNLISTILGESIARIYEHSGAKVTRINYPSDIGPTIAKGVWGLQKLKLDPSDIAQLGQAYVAGNNAFENDEAAKKEIDEINIALYEDSNSEWSELRRKGVETSRRSLDALCAKLGTIFDKEFFESEAAPLGKSIVLAHVEDGIFEKSDGAIVYKGEQDGLHTRVFLNSKGLPTYEAKDLGLFELKHSLYPNFDITITDTGPEQAEYFKVLYAVIRRLYPDAASKVLLHSAHGMLKFTTGKMSSRLGNVITGESLIADLTKEARGREDVAIGAIKYTALRQGSGKDIAFDPAKSLSLEGDSGPYVQYALVRARSLLRKAADAEVVAPEPLGPNLLERLVIHFPEVVAHAAADLEPHYVVTYLTELASAFNSWYASERMIVDGKITSRTLAVLKAVENTLAVGLKVLGIPAPEQM